MTTCRDRDSSAFLRQVAWELDVHCRDEHAVRDALGHNPPRWDLVPSMWKEVVEADVQRLGLEKMRQLLNPNPEKLMYVYDPGWIEIYRELCRASPRLRNVVSGWVSLTQDVLDKEGKEAARNYVRRRIPDQVFKECNLHLLT